MSVAAVEKTGGDRKGACVAKNSERPNDSQRKEFVPSNLEEDDGEPMAVYFERNKHMFQGP